MAKKKTSSTTRTTDVKEMGPWDPILAQLREWDPKGVDLLVKVHESVDQRHSAAQDNRADLCRLECRVYELATERYTPPYPRRP